jgi:thiol:disulfide interchange protein DsbD
MLERILPGAVVLALWAALAFIVAVYLGALEPLGETAGPARRLGKSAGAMAGAYGLILLAGAATGGSNPLQPLGNFSASAPAQVAGSLEFRRVKTVDDLQRELAAAAAGGRPVMLDFTADWCVSCKEMERNTFPHPDVQAALSGAVLLKADVTANDSDDQALLRHFGIFGPPTIAFFDRGGEERSGYRLVGFVAARPFAEHARVALAN